MIAGPDEEAEKAAATDGTAETPHRVVLDPEEYGIGPEHDAAIAAFCRALRKKAGIEVECIRKNRKA